MKRITLIAFLLFSFLSVNLQAQDSKVTTGILAYDQGDYEKALESLNIALTNVDQLKPKNVPKAWIYKGMSLMQLIQNAANKQDMQLLEKYKNAYLDAYESFLQCEASDVDKKYSKQLVAQMNLLYNPMIQMGLNLLTKKQYSNAANYLNNSLSINKRYIQRGLYNDYDLLAQAFLGQRDSLEALNNFNLAIDAFKKSPPEGEDLYVGYIYYRAALLERYKNNDLDQALNLLSEGKSVVESEKKKLKERKDIYTSHQYLQKENQFTETTNDLNAFELDILLNAPEKYKSALLKFENAVQQDPSNILIRIAYAQLLEKTDPNLALDQYNKALVMDPINFNANFNAGAIYYNTAARKTQEANNTDDFKMAGELSAQADEFFKAALPYFETAFIEAPSDRTLISTLKQIYIQLGMDEQYKKMKEHENK